MNRLTLKTKNQALRAKRTRSHINGTADKPRMSAYISNRNVSAQLIDDFSGKTLIAVTSTNQKTIKGSMTDKAVWVGETIAKKAATKKIKKVVFDRGSKLYHGRIKALADAARKGGLEF